VGAEEEGRTVPALRVEEWDWGKEEWRKERKNRDEEIRKKRKERKESEDNAKERKGKGKVTLFEEGAVEVLDLAERSVEGLSWWDVARGGVILLAAVARRLRG